MACGNFHFLRTRRNEIYLSMRLILTVLTGMKLKYQHIGSYKGMIIRNIQMSDIHGMEMKMYKHHLRQQNIILLGNILRLFLYLMIGTVSLFIYVSKV